MKLNKLSTPFILFLFIFLPLLMFGQHHAAEKGLDPALTNLHSQHHSIVFIALEWVEVVVDLVGISILILGFLKGLFFFLKMEKDNLTGDDTFDDILALRSTLGGYIILSLDFLIISDIIHSVIKPEFNDLINLGIIVFLRTSIGFFLGRELMELRHAEKEHNAEHAKKEKHVENVH